MRITAVILMLTMAVSAFAADVAGKWKATMEGPNGSMQLTFDLKVDGNKITGKASGEMGEMKITDGTIDGDRISFAIETDQMKVVHKGTVSGDEMKLKVEVGDNSMEMVAKRVKP
ncbi:hypothetical protein [Paludibaculum fermentans]|uniref:Uncharacterized protein n=1 Tax=Paludibaculum fermentans TaxID=1473598 RepID=A0A7S7NVL9_PALFE|nr:hypothetical protein [Paludibaculum fermentans]QOY90538.1 hypothetical protein IRI77_11480 [Paludibaculum fermentans]